MARRVKYLNVATVCVIVCYLMFNVGYLIYSCDGYFASDAEFMDQTQDVLSWFTASTFLLLAIIFFAVGFRMIQKLKQTFYEFYRQFKYILWTAMILVTLPLTFRAIFDFSRLNKSF